MAVSLVTAKDFLASRRAGIDDPLTGLPGVLAQTRAGGQDIRLTVRGFGSRGNGDRSNAATIRGLKILVDGIPETEPDGRTALDLIDIGNVDRVEVIRTNMSTLFGNASGGVVHFSTISRFGAPFFRSDNAIGSFGLRRNMLSFGTAFAGSWLFLSATNGEFGGWRENSSTRTTSFRANLTSDLGQFTQLQLTSVFASNFFEIPGALTQAEYEDDPRRANSVYRAHHERRNNKLGRLAVRFSTVIGARHSLEFLGFVNPKILERSERNTFRNFNHYHLGAGVVYQWQNESGGFLKRITAGLDEAYQDGTILFYDLVNGERGDSLRSNQREGAETFGIFGQVEVSLIEDVSLVAGSRFDVQRYIAEAYAGGIAGPTRRDRLAFRRWTPRAALLFRFSPNHSAYVNLTQGLEVPAFNEVDPPSTLPNVALNPFLKPMISTTVEAGIKGVAGFSSGFARSLSYSIALYTIRIRNEIVPYNGGAWYFSAGTSERAGAEMGIRAEFDRGISFRGAYTHLRARYISYANDLGEFSRRTVPGIPADVVSTRVRYEQGSGLEMEVEFEHTGRYVADDANSLFIPSSSVWTVSAGYHVHRSPLDGTVFAGIQNVVNTRYIASSFINPAGPSSSAPFIEPGLPRNFFVGIDIRLSL